MNTKGSQRERIDNAEITPLQRNNILIADGRRQRPRWFDGRFLTAHDLTREQNYILARQADLGRAAGWGVGAGLAVHLESSEGSVGDTLLVEAGYGITPNGETVLLESRLRVPLGDIPEALQLSARFGLGPLPRDPARARSGLHVLALRPVEFSTNAGGRYPSAITGERRVEDEDIVEATAVTLVPWPEGEAGEGADRARAAVAHTIFVEGAATRLPANVLPLAMLAIDADTVRWLDVPMVRRELGAHRGDLPGLSPSPRALRVAHLQQYRQHLADILRTSGNQGFAADTVFLSLPPAGPLPPGIIDAETLTQRWLPASVEVDLTPIPEDELAALVESTLLLPPIDLTRGEPVLEGMSVLLLAPVARHDWDGILTTLQETRRALRPAAGNQIARRRPLETLMRMGGGWPPSSITLPVGSSSEEGGSEPSVSSESAWRRLATMPNLWYLLRPHLAAHGERTPVGRSLAGGRERDGEETRRRVADLGLGSDLNGILERATPLARVEITNLLSSPRLQASAALTAVTIGELKRLDQVDHAGTLKATSAITEPEAGAGLARLERTINDFAEPARLQGLADTATWRSLDRQARVVDRTSLTTLSNTIPTNNR